MPSKIDGVLESVGAFSKFQLGQILLCGIGSFTAASHFLIIVFHSITPKFRCSLPDWVDNDTYAINSVYHNETINQLIPLNDDGGYESCKIYTNISQLATVECSSWVFDKSVYWGNTLNMNFGLLCSDSPVETVVKVVFTSGLAVGAFVVGVISDRFGRKKGMVGCMLVGGATGVVAMFSPNIIMYACLRFIIAMCFVGVALLGHVITMEVVGPSMRTRAIAFRSIFWPCGTMFTSLLAYYFQDWNWLQLSISVGPLAGGIIMIFLLKETPHFLVTHGQHEEAEELFKHIAKVNGRTLPEGTMDSLKEDEEEALTEKVKDIFKAPVLLKRAIIFFYLWFIAGLGFYGLNFNVNNLTGSVYINNVISGAAELPQLFIVLFSAKLGRKKPTVAALFLGGTSLVSAAFMTAYLDIKVYGGALVAVSMIGKFSIACVFTFDYFWSSEVFPTTLRSTLVGICSLWARIGSVLSPIIVDLYKYVQTLFGPGLGPLIFGGTMLIGGLLTFILPETNNENLPETIQEANKFMTGRREDEEKYKEDDKTISADGGSERGGDFDPSSKADLVDSTTKF